MTHAPPRSSNKGGRAPSHGPNGAVADSLDEAKAAFRAAWEAAASLSVSDEAHSALMLAARMTLPHFSVSSAISFPKSPGEPERTVIPRSVNRALTTGLARP